MTSPTREYTLTHTMIRVADPARSLEFYRDILGMGLVAQLDFPEGKFSLYFLQAAGNGAPARTLDEVFSRPGLLELTHNWDDEGPMHNGNTDPKGYGHICMAVPDIAAACARMERKGVPFVKRPDEGGMKGIAFIQDPDGYRIELVEPRRMDDIVGKYRVAGA